MIYHILNGDALAGKFPGEALEGERIVFRECLVEGPLDGETPAAFWETRARFIGETYGETRNGYEARVVAQVEQVKGLPGGAEVNLWFEHDLFCQVNTWFLLSLLEESAVNLLINRVMPQAEPGADVWQGFGPADGERLIAAYWNRVPLTRADRALGKDLWEAYRRHDLQRLETLAARETGRFPYLREVVRAHAERYPAAGQKSRPVAVLEDIVRTGTTGFPAIFREFFRREGIYGFGDSQVKRLLPEIAE
ncbi:MAG TPA: hypothetical protein VF646_14305 [Cytophagales bacterium]|jgi:hypothetical protein